MKQERIDLLEQLKQAASELASYASYAEIIGAIHHNRSQIRQYCDQVQEINAKIRHMDENKRFKVKVRQNIGVDVSLYAEQIDGKEYNFTFGWDCDGNDLSAYKGEQAWMVADDTYPDSAPRWLASGDLEAIDD